MREPFAKLLKGLSRGAGDFYRERPVTVAVFSSVARQTATIESDVDFLIVATDLPRGRVKRGSEFPAVENRLEKEMKELEGTGIHT